ncbi:MAG TPA: VOC family protein [Candidatus Thermoplasmatota archaeon]|jgi:predicted 3-demethylubiquinone-9 3-methyltransferase (glyoxalase superfamily)|nr:VOC family protein [Candidatus Thermoplasmatota archaeon]
MATKTTKRTTKSKGAKVKANSITPFLWYERGAEEAARFYVSLVAGSRIKETSPMSTSFSLGGQDFIAFNGGPDLKLNPAFSVFVEVNTQDEIDTLWEQLTADGGEESRCGWLVDRFGLSWQIIPKALPKLLFHKDPGVRERAMQAMLKMQKIDLAELQAAAKGR